MRKRNTILLIIVLMLFLGIVVFIRAMNRPNQSLLSKIVPVATSPSPTSQSFTHVYQLDPYGLLFHYPNGWTISLHDTNGTMKTIQLTSPDGFILTAAYGPAGIAGKCVVDPKTAMGSDPITIMGRPYWIYFEGDQSQGLISYAYLLSQEQPCPNIPFITIPPFMGMPTGLARIDMQYADHRQRRADEFRGDDYQTAKEILSSTTITTASPQRGR